MTGNVTENSLTEGPLLGPILHLLVPLVAMNLLQAGYSLVDVFWLGRLSTDAIGAVGLVMPLVYLLIAVAIGFATAGSILTAQYTGAEDAPSTGEVTGQTLIFNLAASVVVGSLGYVFVEPVLELLPYANVPTVIGFATRYLQVLFLGLPTLFLFTTVSSLFRGHGDSKTPMKIMAMSVLANTALDPFLIFGYSVFPELGIQGAALATVTARGLATIVGLWLLLRTDLGPDFRVSHLWINRRMIRQLASIGFPLVVERSATELALVLLATIVVVFSAPVITAYGLVNRVISLVFLICMAFGKATNTVVGQNLGAGNEQRAKRAIKLMLLLCSGLMVASTIVSELFVVEILELFVPANTNDAVLTMGHGTTYMRLYSLSFIFIGITFVLLGALRGAGLTKEAMGFSLVKLWLFNLPVVYVLAFVADLGALGIWIGNTLEYVLTSIIVVAWFLRDTWQHSLVTESATAAKND